MHQVASRSAPLTDENRYRLLIESIRDYTIYMLSPEGFVTSWNPGAQRFKGYTASEIIGQHFSRFYTPEDCAAGLPKRALDTSLREGKFEQEGWRLRKDGTRFWTHVVIDPICAPDGELLGFAKITRDVSERLQTQQDLENTREALFQSQKMDAIGQLTGGIAHDFNNLLMAVLGSLELARKRMAEDPRITPLLENAVQAAKRGAALTQRMLAFARRLELNLKPVAIPELIDGVTELLRRSLGPQVIVKTDIAATLPQVQGDENQLEMALLNLALNARDAMPNGRDLHISAAEEVIRPSHPIALAPGRYVRLSVADNGEGMDEPILAHALEPFFTTKGIGKGTGLGLPMVHGLVEQSGGRLVLKSRKGEGTVAEVWLPTAALDAAAAAAPACPSASPPRALTIMAVDDDALVLMNTVEMLEELGHNVLQALSAGKALEIMRSVPVVDLLITDQAMPQMTGLQLAEEVGRTWPDMPIVLATGYGELPAGADRKILKLAKPFSEQDLKLRIQDALQAAIRA